MCDFPSAAAKPEVMAGDSEAQKDGTTEVTALKSPNGTLDDPQAKKTKFDEFTNNTAPTNASNKKTALEKGPTLPDEAENDTTVEGAFEKMTTKDDTTPASASTEEDLRKQLRQVERKLKLVYEEFDYRLPDYEDDILSEDEADVLTKTEKKDDDITISRRFESCDSKLETITVKKYGERTFSLSERHNAVDVVIASEQQQTVFSKADDAGVVSADARQRFGQLLFMQINSQALRRILADLTGSGKTMSKYEALIMLAPFKILHYEEEALREKLRGLEKKWSVHVNDVATSGTLKDAAIDLPPKPTEAIGDETDSGTPSTAVYRGALDPETDHGPVTHHGDKSLDPEAEPDIGSNGLTAYKDLKLTMQFFDNHIKPWWAFFRSSNVEKVEFGDLCALFAPGDIVTKPDDFQRMYRVVAVSGGRPKLKNLYDGVTASATKGAGKAEDESSKKAKNSADKEGEAWTSLVLDLYYIDYDGTRFNAAFEREEIDHFSGFKDVKKLRPYPLRLASAELRDECYAEGSLFLELTDPKSKPALYHYEGRTLTNASDGKRLGRSGKFYDDGDIPTSDYLGQEDIDAQVVIDFDMAFLYNSGWSLPSDDLQPASVKDQEDSTSDLPSSCPLRKSWALVQCFHMLDNARRDKLINDDPWLSSAPRPDEGEDKERRLLFGTKTKGYNSHVLLLPNRVYGYVLRNRSWACFDLSAKAHWRRVERNERSWRELQIQESHRSTLVSLVTRHFRNRLAVAKTRTGERMDNFDFIEGKGKGLIILLHGAPGVGKTTTAESIAGRFGKPLLPITCGNLGTDARMVEQSLQENFRIAEAWGCIVLLDEADVFLARRDKNDLQRNALVSVFLRMLEYYSGVLFLTTNRTGDFDEAFRSRIHVSLFYQDLGLSRTRTIWENNLKRVKDQQKNKGYVVTDNNQKMIMTFAERHWTAYSILQRVPWNGRQIRNAFQTAVALAEFGEESLRWQLHSTETQNSDTGAAPVELTWEHFKKVAIATHLFETYLIDVRGKTEDEEADDEKIRQRLYRFAVETDDETGQLKPRKWRKINTQRATELIESLHPDIEVVAPEGLYEEDVYQNFDPFHNTFKLGQRQQSFTRRVASPSAMQTPMQTPMQQNVPYRSGPPSNAVQMQSHAYQVPGVHQNFIPQAQMTHQPYMQQHIMSHPQGQYNPGAYQQLPDAQQLAQTDGRYQQGFVHPGMPAAVPVSQAQAFQQHAEFLPVQPQQALSSQPQQVLPGQPQQLLPGQQQQLLGTQQVLPSQQQPPVSE